MEFKAKLCSVSLDRNEVLRYVLRENKQSFALNSNITTLRGLPMIQVVLNFHLKKEAIFNE
jgi:hypothetical protein